jgi:hypothetical protein
VLRLCPVINLFRTSSDKGERGGHNNWQQNKERHCDKKLLLLVLLLVARLLVLGVVMGWSAGAENI